jgi:hypothetical protein
MIQFNHKQETNEKIYSTLPKAFNKILGRTADSFNNFVSSDYHTRQLKKEHMSDLLLFFPVHK